MNVLKTLTANCMYMGHSELLCNNNVRYFHCKKYLSKIEIRSENNFNVPSMNQ